MENVVYASDRVDVVHARWIERTYERDGITIISYFCSACNGEHYYGRADFCPNCGAKMDGEGMAEDGTVS